MKSKSIIFLTVGLFLSLNSCAPVYKCGDEKPARAISGSNRLLDVVKERDQLCETVAEKEKETAYFNSQNQVLRLKNDSLVVLNDKTNAKYISVADSLTVLQDKHETLKNDMMDLSTKYSTAITEKLNQGHLYDERIKEKERRMDMKEQELADKQAAIDAQMGLLAERESEIQNLEAQIARQDSITKRMNQLLKEALLGFEGDELKTEIKNGKVYVLMSDKLMFASGKASVQNKGKEALGKLAEVLNKNKEFQILVEGHTDNVPIKTSRYQDNWDLSVDRATEIVRILQNDHSVDPLRLTASGRGEFFPRASNSTAGGKAQNRRTEIILSPNLAGLMDFLKD